MKISLIKVPGNPVRNSGVTYDQENRLYREKQNSCSFSSCRRIILGSLLKQFPGIAVEPTRRTNEALMAVMGVRTELPTPAGVFCSQVSARQLWSFHMMTVSLGERNERVSKASLKPVLYAGLWLRFF